MISGCTDKNVHTTGLSDHLLFDHYRILYDYSLFPVQAFKCRRSVALHFRLYRARLGVFFLTAAVFHIPWTVISVLFTGAFTTGPLRGLVGELTFNSLQSLTVSAFVTLVLTVQSIEALHRRSLTVGEGIRRGLRRYWPYVIIVIVQEVPFVVFVPALLGITPEETNEASGNISDFASDALSFYACAIPLILIPFLYLSLRWFVAGVVLIAEEQGPLDSLRRSWRLSQGNVLRIFGYSILLSIIVGLVSILPAYLLQQIVSALLPTSAPGLGEDIFAAASSLLSIISAPFYTGAAVLLYYSLRVRKESKNMELRIVETGKRVAPIDVERED